MVLAAAKKKKKSKKKANGKGEAGAKGAGLNGSKTEQAEDEDDEEETFESSIVSGSQWSMLSTSGLTQQAERSTAEPFPPRRHAPCTLVATRALCARSKGSIASPKRRSAKSGS